MDKEKKKDTSELIETLSKRARLVAEHILSNGSVTTKEIGDLGYNHPPRAVQDLKDGGIPLVRTMVTVNGKRMAKYTFGDPSKIEHHKIGGRKSFSKKFRHMVCESGQYKCAICGERYEERYLQVDHRIPYEIAGDAVGTEAEPQKFMSLCGSHNRAKSWSCEHCANWTQRKADLCTTCYWGSPENYSHVALKEIRLLTISWSGDDVSDYDRIVKRAGSIGLSIADYIKQVLSKDEDE